jgi:hypothetical protein
MPVALIIHKESLLRQYYRLGGLSEVYLWKDYIHPTHFLTRAETLIEDCRSLKQLLNVEILGVRVGRHAVSTALRQLRIGSIDLESEHDRKALVRYVASAMAAAAAARTILRIIRPTLTLMVDNVYTPKGELFDSCLTEGIDAIRWYPAHKSNSLIFKRYTMRNRDEDLNSLSEESWQVVRKMVWTKAHRQALHDEVLRTYAAGDWYSESGTQFRTRFTEPRYLQQRLRLDPGKKTAFIFPHISWDASLMRGQDLFANYEDWFVNTVRAACKNDRVNWVIKIHPAHTGKEQIDGVYGEPNELKALRAAFGRLPTHVHVVPADSAESTLSFLSIMNYCVTVRGTIGLEAASRGIPVITGGTGRYSHRGFTIDSATPEQYLQKLAGIHEMPSLGPAQTELAERYAYGLFVLRPLRTSSISVEYRKDYGPENCFNKTTIHIGSKDVWNSANDLKAFAEWATGKSTEDFLDSSVDRVELAADTCAASR